MEYRIEELDFELVFVGVKQRVVTKDASQTIPTLWEEATNNGLIQKLIDLAWEDPKCKMEGILGICGTQASITDETFDYFMGVRYENSVSEGMEQYTIPKSSTWAVFPNVTEARKRLYTEWIPTSGYELANLPCIECYYAPDQNPNTELWVPIIK